MDEGRIHPYLDRKTYPNLKEALLSKTIVRSENECWGWRARKDKAGYGKLTFRGKNYSSNRASYLVFKGDIPMGMFVCHSCDNPECANPNHLWLGTPKDNMVDCVKKGRNKFTRPTAKLTDDAVKEIRSANKRNFAFVSEMATKYGVAVQTVRDVIYGLRYKHVQI